MPGQVLSPPGSPPRLPSPFGRYFSFLLCSQDTVPVSPRECLLCVTLSCGYLLPVLSLPKNLFKVRKVSPRAKVCRNGRCLRFAELR